MGTGARTRASERRRSSGRRQRPLPKPLDTRVGRIDLRISQAYGYRVTNGRSFHPKALDQRTRRERGVVPAMADVSEIDGRDGSGKAIIEEISGLTVSLPQVSHASAEFDPQPDA